MYSEATLWKMALFIYFWDNTCLWLLCGQGVSCLLSFVAAVGRTEWWSPAQQVSKPRNAVQAAGWMGAVLLWKQQTQLWCMAVCKTSGWKNVQCTRSFFSLLSSCEWKTSTSFLSWMLPADFLCSCSAHELEESMAVAVRLGKAKINKSYCFCPLSPSPFVFNCIAFLFFVISSCSFSLYSNGISSVFTLLLFLLSFYRLCFLGNCLLSLHAPPLPFEIFLLSTYHMSLFIASAFPNEMGITMSLLEEHCVFCWLNSLTYEEAGSGFSQLGEPYLNTGGS